MHLPCAVRPPLPSPTRGERRPRVGPGSGEGSRCARCVPWGSVRQIFPVVRPDGAPGEPLGPVEPLRLAGPISPAGAASWAEDLVASLATIYACPDGLWVRGNMIASADGAIALDGRSGGLSGPADRLVF